MTDGHTHTQPCLPWSEGEKRARVNKHNPRNHTDAAMLVLLVVEGVRGVGG